MTDQTSKRDRLLQLIATRVSDEDALGPLEEFLNLHDMPEEAIPILESLLTSANIDLRQDALYRLTEGGTRVGYEVDILLTLILCLLEDNEAVYSCEVWLRGMRRRGSETAKKAMDVLEKNPIWNSLMGRAAVVTEGPPED
jgi:hypothetical protein